MALHHRQRSQRGRPEIRDGDSNEMNGTELLSRHLARVVGYHLKHTERRPQLSTVAIDILKPSLSTFPESRIAFGCRSFQCDSNSAKNANKNRRYPQLQL